MTEILHNSDAELAAFTQQTIDEGNTGIAIKRRAFELMEQARDKELQGKSADFAGRATYNYAPEGAIGALSRWLDRGRNLPYFGPVLRATAIPFTRIAANVLNATTDYTPLGIIRARYGTLQEGGTMRRIGEGMTEEESKMRMAQGAVGTTMMLLLYFMTRPDEDDKDKEPFFQIHGGGTTNIQQRYQMSQLGWKPRSLQFGKRYISYENSPLAVPLLIIGNLRDYDRYKKDTPLKDKIPRLAISALMAGNVMFDQPLMSGLADLVDAVQTRDFDQQADAVSRIIARSAAGLTPLSNMAKQIQRVFDGEVKNTDHWYETLLREQPWAHWVSDMKPKLNALGEPVHYRESLTNKPLVNFIAGTWYSEKVEHPIFALLARKERFPTVPTMPLLGDRPMSIEEKYQYTELRGNFIKRQVNSIGIPKLEKLNKEQFGRTWERITERASDQAKAYMAAGKTLD